MTNIPPPLDSVTLSSNGSNWSYDNNSRHRDSYNYGNNCKEEDIQYNSGNQYNKPKEN